MNTITTKDETQLSHESPSGRSRAHQRLTPESATLLLIDHQSGLVSGVRDLEPDEVRHNVVAFARVARIFRVPVVLTSTAPMMWGPTLPELTEALPGVENIERSLVNAGKSREFAMPSNGPGGKSS
jgi:nicotinamidase-related amidase